MFVGPVEKALIFAYLLGLERDGVRGSVFLQSDEVLMGG